MHRKGGFLEEVRLTTGMKYEKEDIQQEAKEGRAFQVRSTQWRHMEGTPCLELTMVLFRKWFPWSPDWAGPREGSASG